MKSRLFLACILAGASALAEDGPPPRPAAVEPQPARSAFVHPDTADDLSWQSSLISAGVEARPNQWSAFRREFSLNSVPTRAVARIAVDSKYWLWINGELVIREGGLKRGPTPTDTYFDEVDLRPHLRPGRNMVAVLVWFFGKDGFSHKDSGKGGLVFQLQDETGALLLASDATWKAKVHPAFGDTGEPHPNFRLPESNIRFDATLDLIDWPSPGFDDSTWPAATDNGRVPCAPWNRLVRRPIPLWQESSLRDYVEVKTERGQTVIAQLPYNAQVTPYFEVDAPAGAVIGIQTDNYQGGGANNVRAEYVTRAGRQAFEAFGWMNGHAVHYRFPDGVKILRLGYRESGYATAFAGTFRCDDAFLNRLRAKAERTLYLTMRDTYMDCPDRERAQWWGDVVNELGEVSYAFDRRADALTRKAILELIAWQKPDGVLFSPIPAGNWDGELSLQMLASIGRQGIWTYAFSTGDFETLRAVYPGVKRYLEIWDLKPDGSIKLRRGRWGWGDWGENVDKTLLANLWYHLALQGQLQMAKALGHSGDLPWIEARLQSIERRFHQTFWTGNEFRSPDYRGATDDRANALVVVAGLARPDQRTGLLSVFRREEHASPYMEKYVLEALCLMGEPAMAQERMKRRYARMVDHPHYTTLWEGWGIGEEGFGGGSVNHGWSGGPLTIMSQYFAGIAPTSPAFATYRVYPQLGELREITAGLETPRGSIKVAIRRRADSLELDLNSPLQTSATVGLPAEDAEQITRVRLNGEVIWESGRARPTNRGVKSLGFADGYLRFDVPPGQWTFVAEMKRSDP